MSRDSVVGVVVLIGVLVLLVAGWQLAAAEGATETRIENETATVQSGTNTTLAADGIQYSNTTVIVNGTTYTAGDEYRLDEWAGTVRWTDAAAPDDGETAQISYTVGQQDDTTGALTQLLTIFGDLWGALLFLAVGGWVVTVISNTWGT